MRAVDFVLWFSSSLPSRWRFRSHFNRLTNSHNTCVESNFWHCRVLQCTRRYVGCSHAVGFYTFAFETGIECNFSFSGFCIFPIFRYFRFPWLFDTFAIAPHGVCPVHYARFYDAHWTVHTSSEIRARQTSTDIACDRLYCAYVDSHSLIHTKRRLRTICTVHTY